MKTTMNRSIANRVVLALVSMVTFVLVVVGTIGYQVYSRQQQDELTAYLNLRAEQIAAGIALAVWNFDASQINKIMEATMKNQAVYGLIVQSGDKRYALARGDRWQTREAEPDQFKASDLLVKKRDIIFGDSNVGKLQLFMTPKFMHEHLAKTRRMLIGSVVLLDILLILSLYLIIRRNVLLPLQFIEKYAVSVSSGQKDEAIAITRPLRGEFNELQNSLQKMVTLLETRLEDLTESHDRFWKLVSGFPIGLALYSPTTGKITSTNRKFVELFGYTIDEVSDVGAWFKLAYPDEEYRREVLRIWNSEVEAAIKNSRVVQAHEYQVTCKDGSVKTIEIGGVSSGDALMGVFIDVTERKRAEAEVHAYQEHLEELVELRTQELVVARDLAEEANRAKSVFLANMSHELRTPLNSVIGFSRTMANDPELSPRQHRNLEIINRSGTHLLTLINDILELSKIEAGKMELVVDSVDLRLLLQEIVDMLRQRAEQQGISLVVESSNLPSAFVQVDIAKLRQVLLNLVTNAIKFTSKGGVTVVANGACQGERMQVEFRVIDTGIGIHSDDQKQVFEPFVQVGQMGERSGTGLGLAISRQYVQMMGGELTLHSIPGEGATFSFSLQLPISASALSHPELTPKQTGSMMPVLKDYRVLIADDTQDMRMLLRELLIPLGLQVWEAENGEQAKEIIYAQQPHLVLMDWRMPVLDGVELTRIIRADKSFTQPRIIMLTANAFDENRREALAAGVDEFMSKPIDIDVLYQMVERHVGIQLRREGNGIKSGLPHVEKLSPQNIGQLSPTIHDRFSEALRELNPARINEVLSELRTENSGIADSLQAYVSAMQYRKLWQLFGILDD